MTDVQQPPAETPSDAYGQPISADRQAKLQQMLDAWDGPNADHGDRKGPFDGVRLTGAEVFWLAKASGRDRYDGRVPNLHLERAYLSEAHLEGANFYEAHLERTYLFHAHFKS